MDITVLVNFRLVKISKTVLKRNIENRLFIWYNALRQKLRVVRKDNKNPGSCSCRGFLFHFFRVAFICKFSILCMKSLLMVKNT